MTDNTRSSAEIEKDLDAKRARIDDTIDALQAKLSPGELLDQGLGYLRGSGANDFGANLGRTVRDNPLPIALVGIGLTWLIASGQSRGGNGGYGDRRPGGYDSGYGDEPEGFHGPYGLEEGHYGHGSVAAGDLGLGELEGEPVDRNDLEQSHYGHEGISESGGAGRPSRSEELAARVSRATSSVSRKQDETKEAFEERVYAARGRVLDMQRQSSESLEAFKARVDARYHDALARARAGTEAVRRRAAAGRAAASSRTRALGRQAQGFGEDVGELFREQPLLLGAVGCAVGAFLGALMPPSRREDELLGPHRDRLTEDLQAAGEDLVERAGAVGDRAARTAGDAAEREGLTPEGARRASKDVVERATRVASETEASTRDEARRQGFE